MLEVASLVSQFNDAKDVDVDTAVAAVFGDKVRVITDEVKIEHGISAGIVSGNLTVRIQPPLPQAGSVPTRIGTRKNRRAVRQRRRRLRV